jgi:hypothetical protein
MIIDDIIIHVSTLHVCKETLWIKTIAGIILPSTIYDAAGQ